MVAPEAETGDDDSIEDFHDRSSTRSRGFNQERLTIEQLEALSPSAKADYDKRRRVTWTCVRPAKPVLRKHGFVDDRLALDELLTRSLALFTAAILREPIMNGCSLIPAAEPIRMIDRRGRRR
jgi:hypothetical protein